MTRTEWFEEEILEVHDIQLILKMYELGLINKETVINNLKKRFDFNWIK